MSGVLVDTSVWVHHFKQRNDELINLLAGDMVLMHPLVLGELACGTPPGRERTLADLGLLHCVKQASSTEVMNFIDREKIYGLGCGLVDVTLLASTLITPGAKLWTLDQTLSKLCDRFGVAYRLAGRRK